MTPTSGPDRTDESNRENTPYTMAHPLHRTGRRRYHARHLTGGCVLARLTEQLEDH